VTPPTTAEIGPLRAVENLVPFEYYARLRELGDVVWDDDLNGWIVTSFDLVREITRRDEDIWERTYSLSSSSTHLGMTDAEWEWFIGAGSARASLFMITGRAHAAQHRWWMRAFSSRLLEQWRATLIGPCCREELDRFAGRGRTELVVEYAEPVASRTMAAMLGLPGDDRPWLARLINCFARRGALLARHEFNGAPDPAVQADAFAATHELHAAVLPYVRERRSGEGSDFISMVWREAPELFGDDYDEIDVFAAAMVMWAAGAGSTASGAKNTLYLVLQHPELHDRLRTDVRARRTFVEEAVRLYDLSSWKARYARLDVVLGGVPIKKGEKVLALTGAAHRDERHYTCPHEVDLDRPSPRDHFGFFAGARACPGQGLARLEIEEMLLALLERVPDVRLDPDAAPPQFKGLFRRDWEPLNVVFTPVAAG
jgi:cytochrome P450